MRRSTLPCALLLLLIAACQLPTTARRTLAPLGDEGEVYVYLDPMPAAASGLSVSIAALGAVPQQGAAVTLEVFAPQIVTGDPPKQRLLAFGRLPTGEYRQLLLTVRRATLKTDQGISDLLVDAAPYPVPVPLTAMRGRASVLSLSFDTGSSIAPSFRFTPTFTVVTPTTGMVPVSGFCSTTGAAISVFDKHAHRAVGVFPVGREPQGLALYSGRNRGYVALAGDDQVEAFDLITGIDLGRATLRNGDRPREVALTPDGRTLLVVNEGSNTVSFVDTRALTEVDRLSTGLEPRAILLDRSGRRAYVLNRRVNSMTVIDVANRAVVTTVTTDPDPLRAQLNRAGDRLYLIHGGSQFLNVYSLPALTLLKRVFVGLGASALKVDSRSDLVYVALQTRVQVFDPFSLLPITSFELPGVVTWLTIDDVENALVATLADRRGVAFVDLTTRRVTGEVEVGFDPFQPAVVGER